MKNKKKIVIAEDSPTQAMRLQFSLENYGYSVLHGRNGLEALKLIENDIPDLVISDVNMPIMDGYELCKKIKENDKIKDIPVIILTSLSQINNVIFGLECGADGFHTKPFDEEELIKQLNEFLGNEPQTHIEFSDNELIVSLNNSTYKINSDPGKILSFLIATYRIANQKNTALEESNKKLNSFNELLDQKVKQKTQELVDEIQIRKNAEQQLRSKTSQLIQSEKTSAVGTLAAGVAHELNNPLMGIQNFADYCKKKTSPDNKIYDVINDIKFEAKRCSEIVANLLTFTRQEDTENKNFINTDITGLVNKVLRLLDYKITKNNIKVILDFEENLPEIKVLPNQIQQVLLNIIGNAVDALEKSETKDVIIKTISNDSHIIVKIKDTGEGIKEKNKKKIFDAFFTTKETDKGTGLGLSICKGIIEDHKGEISFETEENTGTEFMLKLNIDKKK